MQHCERVLRDFELCLQASLRAITKVANANHKAAQQVISGQTATIISVKWTRMENAPRIPIKAANAE